MSEFANYRFNVADEKFERLNWAAANREELLQLVNVRHHSQVVLFIIECQTYKSANARNLAIELAKHYNPERGISFPSQATLAERLGVKVGSIGRYANEMMESGYWQREKHPVTGGYIYSFTDETLIVCGEWVRRDSDNTDKARYGYGTPVLESASNESKSRSNSRFKLAKYAALIEQVVQDQNLSDNDVDRLKSHMVEFLQTHVDASDEDMKNHVDMLMKLRLGLQEIPGLPTQDGNLA